LEARVAAGRETAGGPRGGEAKARAGFAATDKALNAVRTEALESAAKLTGSTGRDVNYIIPHFVLAELPIGLTGLFIAAVIAAAMSAVAGELASLSSCTVIDLYRRWVRPEASDEHFLKVSRAATGVWGIFACGVAIFAANLGSLIEVVNRFGSFFYGSILGVFLLAMIPRARANGAFFGLVAGMTVVALVNFGRSLPVLLADFSMATFVKVTTAPRDISFLWDNVIGAVTVVAVGMLLSSLSPASKAAAKS